MTPQPRAALMVVTAAQDVVRLRAVVRAFARAQHLDDAQVMLLVATTGELALNMLVYAGAGTVRMQAVARPGRTGVCLVFQDDPREPAVPGVSPGDDERRPGAVAGLDRPRRLLDEFRIDWSPQRGTRVRVTQWGPRPGG
ncbi:ATP-binding protein [Streptacidiphilus sp. PAMC 29251]